MTTTALPLVWLLIIGFGLIFGLAVFALVVFVLVRGLGGRNTSAPPRIGAAGVVPPVVDDSFTNPANPMYHLHHGAAATTGSIPSPSMNSTPAPSFDAGTSSAPSFDAGSSGSVGSDSSGNNCG